MHQCNLISVFIVRFLWDFVIRASLCNSPALSEISKTGFLMVWFISSISLYYGQYFSEMIFSWYLFLGKGQYFHCLKLDDKSQM